MLGYEYEFCTLSFLCWIAQYVHVTAKKLKRNLLKFVKPNFFLILFIILAVSLLVSRRFKVFGKKEIAENNPGTYVKLL